MCKTNVQRFLVVANVQYAYLQKLNNGYKCLSIFLLSPVVVPVIIPFVKPGQSPLKNLMERLPLKSVKP